MKNLFKISVYIVLLAIFILSVIKISDNNLPENSDKIVHFVMYFFCAGAFYLLKAKHYLFCAIGYGLLIEIIQYFLPWRSFSFGDIIANSLGALFFFAVARLYFEKQKDKKSIFLRFF
jgi:VanZ family protein